MLKMPLHLSLKRLVRPVCSNCHRAVVPQCFYSQSVKQNYDDAQRDKILKVVNTENAEVLSSYNITKGRLKKLFQWRKNNGVLKNLADIELMEGFNTKTATKLFDSILEGPMQKKEQSAVNKIKGQVLQPNISEDVRKSCKTVLAVYVTVSSVCWTLMEKSSYEVLQWEYYGINYPEGKRFQITDILDLSWRITQRLPLADVYVMKAEATTLRASGSDPNNPKVLAVNLQKAQMVAMIVALINARSQECDDEPEVADEGTLKQKVYFLRPSLPYRLYGTLVGNERVSTDQTIEMLLQTIDEKSKDGSTLYMSDELKSKFRTQPDLQKDMLGHCLLLGLTFMDLCVYKNQSRLRKLLKAGE